MYYTLLCMHQNDTYHYVFFLSILLSLSGRRGELHPQVLHQEEDRLDRKEVLFWCRGCGPVRVCNLFLRTKTCHTILWPFLTHLQLPPFYVNLFLYQYETLRFLFSVQRLSLLTPISIMQKQCDPVVAFLVCCWILQQEKSGNFINSLGNIWNSVNNNLVHSLFHTIRTFVFRWFCPQQTRNCSARLSEKDTSKAGFNEIFRDSDFVVYLICCF